MSEPPISAPAPTRSAPGDAPPLLPPLPSSSSAVSSAWERLDAPAATPQRRGNDTSSGPHHAIRLRRSRSNVLASLDGGASVLQQRGRDVLVGCSMLLVPVVALNAWATTMAFDRSGATTLTAFGGDAVGTGIEDVAAVLAVAFASFSAALVGYFAAMVLLGERFGVPVGMWPALRLTIRRLPAVLVAWALGHVWLPFLVTWALSSPSADLWGRLVLILPLAGVLSTFTLLTVPVMVAESSGPVGALRRSTRLARGRFGPAFAFVLSSTVIGSLLLAGIGYLPALAEVTGFITFGGYTWFAQSLATQLAVIVVVPLIALGTAQMYLTVRLDAEGMDITMDADAAFGSRIVPL